MASFENAQAVENIIDYDFGCGHDGLLKALTAAGAVEEDWDGNRKLTQPGTVLRGWLSKRKLQDVNARPHVTQNKAKSIEEPDVELTKNPSSTHSIQAAIPTEDGVEEALRPGTVKVLRQARRFTEKRAVVHRAESRRRKKPRECDVDTNKSVFDECLTGEEDKCQVFGQSTPQNTFLTPPIQPTGNPEPEQVEGRSACKDLDGYRQSLHDRRDSSNS
ncbi:hypothetical protein EJ07DRAFT_159640 [Lizonia empirigonia]|nr:hypothetical protein EJ07DRAFT_159640 [Lizonia empirigonia]